MKKMTKRFLAVLLAALLLCGGLALGASAESSEDWEYVTSGGDIIITGYKGDRSDVWVPGSLDSFEVTKIGDGAFANCTGIKQITVGPNITSIGDAVFSGCTALEIVTFVGEPLEISETAFADCSAIRVLVTGWSSIGTNNGQYYVDIPYKSSFQISAMPGGDAQNLVFESTKPKIVSVDAQGTVTSLKTINKFPFLFEIYGWGSPYLQITDTVTNKSFSYKVQPKLTFVQWVLVFLLLGWLWL